MRGLLAAPSALLLLALLLLAPRAAAPEEPPIHIRSDHWQRNLVDGRHLQVYDGHVRIDDAGRRVRSDWASYDEASEVIDLRGNVEVEDGATIIRAPFMRYRRRERKVEAQGGVQFTDGSVSGTSEKGEYHRDERRLVLVDEVRIVDEERVVTGDRATYHMETGQAEVTGSVRVEDKDGGGDVVTGARLLYDRKAGLASMTAGPRMALAGEGEGADTTVVRSEWMHFRLDEDGMTAVGTVVIEADSTTARSDTAHFHRAEERVELRGGPEIVSAGDRITGREIDLHFQGDEIERIDVRGEAFAESHTTSPALGMEEWNEVEGGSMVLHLREGALSEVAVHEGSTDRYRRLTLGDPPVQETNEIRGESLLLLMSGGAARSIRAEGGGEGTYTKRRAPDEAGLAEPPAEGEEEIVLYRAMELEYVIADRAAYLSEKAVVEQKDLRLEAEKIVYHAEEAIVEAEGEPHLYEGDQLIEGTELAYELPTGHGAVRDGRTAFQEGYYGGKKLRKVGEGVLNVDSGGYTTCELAEPHYRISSHRMKIYLRDKGVARPLVLRIHEIPLMFLPYYIFPLGDDRQSGFLFPRIEPGFDEKRGRFVRDLGYYWAINDYTDLTFLGTWYESLNWVFQSDFRYNLRYRMQGGASYSFLRESDGSHRRWDLQANHQQDVGETWKLSARADFVSDKSFRQDIYSDDRLNRSLRSHLNLSRSWSSATLNLTVDRNEYLDTGRFNADYPTATLSVRTRSLVPRPEDKEELRWYHAVNRSYRASFFNTRATGSDSRQAYEHSGGFSAPWKPGGWLTLSPDVSWRQTVYDRDRLGDRLPVRTLWDAGLRSSFQLFSRPWLPEWGPIVGFRHSIRPSATYGVTPQFPQYFANGTDRFDRVGGTSGTPRRSQRMSLSLENRVEGKVRQGEEEKKLGSLLVWNLATGYDFLYRERGDEHPFSDLSSTVRMEPGSLFHVTFNSTHGLYSEGVKNLSLQTTVRFSGESVEGPVAVEEITDLNALSAGTSSRGTYRSEEEKAMDDVRQEAFSANQVTKQRWDASFTHTYRRGATPGTDRSSANGQLAFHPARKWRLSYSAQYDLVEEELVSQQYTLHRDLHCWESQLFARYSRNNWQFYFKINSKGHPDVLYLERHENR